MTCSLSKNESPPLIAGLTILARIIARDMIEKELSRESGRKTESELEKCKI